MKCILICSHEYNSHNDVIHQTSSNCSNVGSALVAKVLAVKTGLKAARFLGLSKLIVKSDSK